MRIKKGLSISKNKPFPHVKSRPRPHSRPQFTLQNKRYSKKHFSLLSLLLLSSTLMSPAYGMLESETFETCSLSATTTTTTQVNHKRQDFIPQTYDELYAHIRDEKKLLTVAILEAIQAEPNEADRAIRTLNHLTQSLQFQSQASDSIKQKLIKLQPRLLQPEKLVLTNETIDFLDNPRPNHPALGPFRQIIDDLNDLGQDTQFQELSEEKAHVFFALKTYYEQYVDKLLAPNAKRAALLRPKAILCGEGLMNPLVGTHLDGIHSYRISQELALTLLSKDRHGLFLKKNASGSHGVCHLGQVHFKGNTTANGLSVGKESASYCLMKMLFGEGMTPSALLTLNDVDITIPREGTQARIDYGLAANYALRLLTKNPSLETLESIQPGELGLFCEDHKLYCKISTKEKIEIVRSDSSRAGINFEIFDRILEILQSMPDANPWDNNLLTLPDQNTVLQYAFWEGYTKETNITSADFLARYPQHQDAFAEQNPHHVLQASLHVEGISLEHFMRGVETAQYAYDDIDLKSFSQHIIMSLLTNPSDGTPGNFMLKREPNISSNGCLSTRDKFAIVGIDNDMAFGPPVMATKVGKDTYKPSLEVKNVLYCLPLMNKPLNQEVRKRILNVSPELVFLRWLDQLNTQSLGYNSLKDTGYHKEGNTQAVPYLKEEVYTWDLHLPLAFPVKTVEGLLKDFLRLQEKIRSRPAITHSQLFSYLQPLAHRFYATLNKKYPVPLSAYQFIHNNTHEEIYLEEILAPHSQETLTSNETIEQALLEVQPNDQAQKQTLMNCAQSIWTHLDLRKQTHVTPFLELAAGSFSSCFQNTSTLHESWREDSLLHRALSEGVSPHLIEFLLNHLKLNVNIRDGESQQTTLHYAIQRKYSPDVFSLLLNSVSSEERANLLNGEDHEGLTPLDHAMTQDDVASHAFLALRKLGATHCNARLALRFYNKQVKSDPNLHIAFRELMDLNADVEWHVTLEELLPLVGVKKGGTETDKKKTDTKIKDAGKEKEDPHTQMTLISGTSSERQISIEIQKQIIKEGQFISVGTDANHKVAYAFKDTPLKRHALYLKVFPALPGLEEAAGRFTRDLLGFGAPHTDLVRLRNVPIILSQAIPGETLNNVLKTKPHLLKELDDEDISGLFIAAMLTNPEDGKPANYIVTPHPTKSGKYRIIGIDNDQAFVPAIVKEKPETAYFTGKLIPVAQVKTILYCFDQMKDSIHPNIRTKIINTPPDTFLQKWLEDLKRVSNQHFGLFDELEQHQLFEKQDCFIGVPFQAGAITHIYEKFVQLRNLVTEHPHITHIDLLAQLEQRLAKRYQDVLAKDISVEARFNDADRSFYEVKKNSNQQESHTTVTKSGNVLQSMGISLKETVFDSIRLGKDNSPTQALKELERIKTEIQTITLESLAACVGDLDLLKVLTLEEKRAAFLKLLDEQKKRLNPTEQEAVLAYLSTQKNIQELPLPHFTFLRDELFQRLNFEHLKKLDLRHCTHSGFTNDSLIHLSQKALGLEVLNLGSLTQLTTIGDVRVWDIAATRDAPLIFSALHTLILSGCRNLTKLLMKAPLLHYLNIENCSKLTDQMLDGVIEYSTNLKKLVFEGCDLITEREMREKAPNFPSKYWEDVEIKKREALLQILKNTGSKLNLVGVEIDISPRGLMVLERALKINFNLGKVTSLNLNSCAIGDEGINVFAHGAFPNLVQLTLIHNNIGYTGPRNLANGNLSNLTSLHLWNNEIGAIGAAGLANGNLSNLTLLSLRGDKIGDEGTQALANGNLSNLRRLDLEYNEIGATGVQGLANGNLSNLTKLILDNNKLGDVGGRVLAQNNLINLRSLALKFTDMGAKGISALANGNLTNLTELTLSHTLGTEGSNELAYGNLTNLTSLSWNHSSIGTRGAKALVSGSLSALTLLDLGSSNIGDEGTQNLATGNLSNLTSLSLWHNNIGDAGAQSLANGNLSNLTSLSLWHNNIGDAGTLSLANGNLFNLTLLDLGRNNIGVAGVQNLANGNLTCLISLGLWENNIGAVGVQALANGNLTNLTLLDLRTNNIGDAGAHSLATGNLSNLTSLCLDKNNIRDAGAQSLANGNLSNLTKLNLWENNIGSVTEQLLRRRYPKLNYLW